MLQMTQHGHQQMMMAEDVEVVVVFAVEMTQQLGHDFDFSAAGEMTRRMKKKMPRLRSHPHPFEAPCLSLCDNKMW
jgi:hypothetical protein